MLSAGHMQEESSLIRKSTLLEKLKEYYESFSNSLRLSRVLRVKTIPMLYSSAGLKHFLEHPDIPLSNIHVEREIRPIALGRKNWLFSWSEVGAKYTAITQTLIQCCKIQQINPWDYILDVLQRINHHPASEVHLLTPKSWESDFNNNPASRAFNPEQNKACCRYASVWRVSRAYNNNYLATVDTARHVWSQ